MRMIAIVTAISSENKSDVLVDQSLNDSAEVVTKNSFGGWAQALHLHLLVKELAFLKVSSRD